MHKIMQIDRDNFDKLSDQELFKALKLFNINSGPVTHTTRSLYEKKLRSLMKNTHIPSSSSSKTVSAQQINIIESETKEYGNYLKL